MNRYHAHAKCNESEVIKDAIGDALSALLMEYKTDEWARYSASMSVNATTNFEISALLNYHYR